MMRIHRMTSLDPMLARDLSTESGSAQPPAPRGRAPKAIDRRSMLAGLGMASAAAVTALAPGSAKAHGWGGWGNGWGGWGGCNDPEDVVSGLLGALEMLDIEEIMSWVDDDVVFQNTGLPDMIGSEAMAQFMSPLAPALESMTIDVVSLMAKGNVVCAERIEHFVIAPGSPIGIPGAELTMRVAGWFEVEHGVVVRWSDYWDTQVFSSTLGIPLPAP
jgi:limonene-1,2-epoxide hydrolase